MSDQPSSDQPSPSVAPLARIRTSRTAKLIAAAFAVVLLVVVGAAGGQLVLSQPDAAPPPAPKFEPVFAPADEPNDAVLSVQYPAEADSAYPYCTAALIRPQWAVTVAHCVTAPPVTEKKDKDVHELEWCGSVDLTQRPVDPLIPPSAPLMVRGATNDYRHGGQTAQVVEVRAIPGYDWGQGEGPEEDFALLRLDHPLAIVPMAIAAAGRQGSDAIAAVARQGSHARAAGWATWPDRCGGVEPAMQQWDLTIADCPDADFDLVCGTTGGKPGPCRGASGGPLYTTAADGTKTVIGVYSRARWKHYCGQSTAMFTLLSAHQDFISAALGS